MNPWKAVPALEAFVAFFAGFALLWTFGLTVTLQVEALFSLPRYEVVGAMSVPFAIAGYVASRSTFWDYISDGCD